MKILFLCALFALCGCRAQFDPIRDSRYEIMDNGHRYFYTDYISQNNGCVEFVDLETKNDSKVCGNFSIEDRLRAR